MSVERVEKEAGKESAARKVADMDSLCEEISRAIVEGLVEKQILDEPEIAPPAESQVAETAVIAPLDDLQADRMVTAVENLLESDEVSQHIVRLVQEKIEQVLNEDVVQSKRGDSGIIAERVHLECTRLFARASFRSDIVSMLRADVENTLAPALRRDLSAYVRGVLAEVTGLLVERVVGVLRNAREITLAPSPAPIAAESPAVGAPAAPDVQAQRCAARAQAADVSPLPWEANVATEDLGDAASSEESAAEAPAGEGDSDAELAFVVESEPEDQTTMLAIVPSAVEAPTPHAIVERDPRAAEAAYARIRERLWWGGVL